MAVIQLTEATDAQVQLSKYNENIGGTMNRRATFSVPANIHWAVVGCVLSDAATPELVASTLVPAVTALDEVTSVNGDQLYGQIPASVLAEGYEAVLNVTATLQATITAGNDSFTDVRRQHATAKPPVGKKWCVLILRVPAALDNTAVSALETAIDGISGVDLCEHLVDGSTPSRTSGNATLEIACHVRLEPVEV